MEAAKPIDIKIIPKNIKIKAKTDKGNNILIQLYIIFFVIFKYLNYIII